MRTFRTLRADEIECRISEVNKKGKGVTLLLYKTARTDAQLLDETFGPMNWQADYRMIGDRLYCGIGVRDEGGEWIWKWNVGTESNTEAEKGQASDALKRAGFTWGVGTELYSSPRVFIPAGLAGVKEDNGKWRCYDKFSVFEIEYNDREEISKLVLLNETQDAICFSWHSGIAPAKIPESEKLFTDPKPAPPPPPVQPKSPEDIKFRCEKCGEVLRPYENDGKTVPIRKHAARSEKIYGAVFCLDCIQKMEPKA